MSGEVYNILISRSKYIERDRSIAILRLEEDCDHLVGQPVMVRYYTDESQTNIDAVVAIGIKNGKGKDCFKVLSLGGLFLVRDVTKELPDVSKLVHGEIYVSLNEDNSWCFVYEISGVRQIEPIVGGPFIFSSIEDNYRWFFRDGKLKREDDFNSSEEFDKIVEEYNKKIEEAIGKIDKLEEVILKNNSKIYPLRVSFYDGNNSGGIHTIYQSGTRTGINFLIRVSIDDADLETGEINTLDVTKDCYYTLNEQKISITQENTYTVENISKTTDFTLIAEYVDPVSNIKKRGIAYYTVEFGYLIRYGKVSNSWEVTEKNVKSLTNSKLSTKNSIISINESLNDEKIVIAAPKSFGKFTMAYDSCTGLNCIGDYSISNCSVDGIDYFVFIKDTSLKYDNFIQIFSYSSKINTEGTSSEESTVTSSDLESLRQEILGGASSDYNTLYKIEKKIKSSSNRDGIVAGNGIVITNNEDGSSTISVNSDNSSISINNGDNTVSVDTVDGGYY